MNKRGRWYHGKVVHGTKLGRRFGYPTINLEDSSIMKDCRKGVYATLVKLGKKIYHGVLYFGPKYILNEQKDVIEIFIFDFTGNLYDSVVSVQPIAYLRPPVKVSNFAKLTQLIEQDCKKVQSLLQ